VSEDLACMVRAQSLFHRKPKENKREKNEPHKLFPKTPRPSNLEFHMLLIKVLRG